MFLLFFFQQIHKSISFFFFDVRHFLFSLIFKRVLKNMYKNINEKI